MTDAHPLWQQLFDLSGRVALVTGATKGLGKRMARTLAEAGADVALCSRHRDEAEAVAADIADTTGRKTLGLAADVAEAESVGALIEETETRLGPVDILVASAGINIRKGTDELTEEDWDAIVNINLKGAFLSARAVLPGMRERKWGRVVFLGSILSFVSIEGRAAYSSSKAGLVGLTKTLALEAAPDGVCVNALCPGPFDTPMNQPVTQDPEAFRAFIAKLPIGRWGDPDEIRGITLYLCSPACSFMTGSAVLIDGGWTAR